MPQHRGSKGHKARRERKQRLRRSRGDQDNKSGSSGNAPVRPARRTSQVRTSSPPRSTRPPPRREQERDVPPPSSRTPSRPPRRAMQTRGRRDHINDMFGPAPKPVSTPVRHEPPKPERSVAPPRRISMRMVAIITGAIIYIGLVVAVLAVRETDGFSGDDTTETSEAHEVPSTDISKGGAQ